MKICFILLFVLVPLLMVSLGIQESFAKQLWNQYGAISAMGCKIIEGEEIIALNGFEQIRLCHLTGERYLKIIGTTGCGSNTGPGWTDPHTGERHTFSYECNYPSICPSNGNPWKHADIRSSLLKFNEKFTDISWDVKGGICYVEGYMEVIPEQKIIRINYEGSWNNKILVNVSIPPELLTDRFDNLNPKVPFEKIIINSEAEVIDFEVKAVDAWGWDERGDMYKSISNIIQFTITPTTVTEKTIEIYLPHLQEGIFEISNLPPKKYFQHYGDVQCKIGFELIQKSTNGSFACVKPLTANVLKERGWTNS